MNDLGAAVIHDVKNQLAELALRLERRGDCGRETGIVLGAARRLTGLLIAHRQAAGMLAANVDSASPAELLRELAEEYRTLFPALEVLEESAGAPAFWFYDEALIRLALANAVHNACRHANETVRLSACAEDGRLMLEVRDDGPGYPPSMLEHAEATAPTGHGGTGLGLYLARKIAGLHQLHGRCGEVALANRDGACFTMRLP